MYEAPQTALDRRSTRPLRASQPAMPSGSPLRRAGAGSLDEPAKRRVRAAGSAATAAARRRLVARLDAHVRSVGMRRLIGSLAAAAAGADLEGTICGDKAMGLRSGGWFSP
jgi:hypothetical protein